MAAIRLPAVAEEKCAGEMQGHDRTEDAVGEIAERAGVLPRPQV